LSKVLKPEDEPFIDNLKEQNLEIKKIISRFNNKAIEEFSKMAIEIKKGIKGVDEKKIKNLDFFIGQGLMKSLGTFDNYGGFPDFELTEDGEEVFKWFNRNPEKLPPQNKRKFFVPTFCSHKTKKRPTSESLFPK